MRLSDLFFIVFYGFAFSFVAYFIYRFLIKSNTTTIIYKQPIYEVSETPVTQVIYPWYSGYTYGPWWSYNWGGGYGGPGYYGSRHHWRPRTGGHTRPFGSGGSSRGPSGPRTGGGGGRRH